MLLLQPQQTKVPCKVKFSSDSNCRGRQGAEDKGPVLEGKPKLHICRETDRVIDPHTLWLLISFHFKSVHFLTVKLYSLILTYVLLLVIKRIYRNIRATPITYLVLSHRPHGRLENRSGVVMHLLASLW